MPQVALSPAGEIVLWVISGLLFTVAFFITVNVFILPYFRAKRTNYINGPRAIPSRVDPQVVQLRQQIDSLINDIDEFVSRGEPPPEDIYIGHSEMSVFKNQNDNSLYGQKADNLFDIKFSNRLMNVIYFLRRRGIISEKEEDYINWIRQPSHLDTETLLSLLKEYRLRLN